MVSRKDYDDTIANYEAAIASHQAAQAKVKEAELNLSYTQVTAPINGMASKSSQSEGSPYLHQRRQRPAHYHHPV